MKIDSNDGRLFDIKGVHPNFVLGNDKANRVKYCKKTAVRKRSTTFKVSSSTAREVQHV